jgi:hypothetical protein
MRKALKIVLWTGMGLLVAWAGVVALALAYVPVVVFGGIRPIPLPGICLKESMGAMLNVSGFDFEFEETNCDVIAKEALMTIFVSRHGEHQRFALAKYEGGIPIVTSIGPAQVRIRLGQVSGWDYRRDTWNDLQIVYDFEIFKPFPNRE